MTDAADRSSRDRGTDRTRRTAPKEERVQQLVWAAMETIAVHGLSATTTAMLTEKAGLSAGIINLHFGNKENLLLETLRTLVMEHRAGWVAAAEDATLDPAARLWALMEAHFAPEICNPIKIAVWFAFFGEARHREAYLGISESFDNERSDFMDDCCEAIIAEGGYTGLDPERLSQLIESTADGLWLDMLLYPHEVSPQLARDQMRSFLHAFFPRHFAPPALPSGAAP
ncbi:MAG: TetR family transcriptional regulator C-terminal domain-containing protein [Rhodobacteraceae bacterium]|nr:TetR family transcriptional regulator C-terminal domain-containing protein [Paracoccaceae bacterium]